MKKKKNRVGLGALGIILIFLAIVFFFNTGALSFLGLGSITPGEIDETIQLDNVLSPEFSWQPITSMENTMQLGSICSIVGQKSYLDPIGDPDQVPNGCFTKARALGVGAERNPSACGWTNDSTAYTTGYASKYSTEPINLVPKLNEDKNIVVYWKGGGEASIPNTFDWGGRSVSYGSEAWLYVKPIGKTTYTILRLFTSSGYGYQAGQVNDLDLELDTTGFVHSMQLNKNGLFIDNKKFYEVIDSTEKMVSLKSNGLTIDFSEIYFATKIEAVFGSGCGAQPATAKSYYASKTLFKDISVPSTDTNESINLLPPIEADDVNNPLDEVYELEPVPSEDIKDYQIEEPTPVQSFENTVSNIVKKPLNITLISIIAVLVVIGLILVVSSVRKK